MAEGEANHWNKKARGRLRIGYRAAGMALIPLLSFVLLWVVYTYTMPNKSAPKAEQGVIDLRGWEFGAKRTVLLDGEWLFYPSELYSPDDFRRGSVPPDSASYAKLPNAWAGNPVDEASAAEYGTYRLIVKLSDRDRGYGLRLPNVNGAHRLYVNGQLAGSGGRPADNEQDYVKENKPYMTFVRSDDAALDIVLQSANWGSRSSGGLEDVQLGLQSDMLLIEKIYFAVEFTGLFILLLFAGYHLTIYLLRM